MTLRQWAAKKKRSQASIAAELDVDQTSVSKWLAGKVKPQIEHAIAIERMTRGAVPVAIWAKQAAA